MPKVNPKCAASRSPTVGMHDWGNSFVAVPSGRRHRAVRLLQLGFGAKIEVRMFLLNLLCNEIRSFKFTITGTRGTTGTGEPRYDRNRGTRVTTLISGPTGTKECNALPKKVRTPKHSFIGEKGINVFGHL